MAHSIDTFPTLLGGEEADLTWEQLTPWQVLRATHGSAVRAEAAIPLVEDAIHRAHEDQAAAGLIEDHLVVLQALRNMAEREQPLGAAPLNRLRDSLQPAVVEAAAPLDLSA